MRDKLRDSFVIPQRGATRGFEDHTSCWFGRELTHRNIIPDVHHPTVLGRPPLRCRWIREMAHRNVFSNVVDFIPPCSHMPDPGPRRLSRVRGSKWRLGRGRGFSRYCFRNLGASLRTDGA
jgi:hypothetical protein